MEGSRFAATLAFEPDPERNVSLRGENHCGRRIILLKEQGRDAGNH